MEGVLSKGVLSEGVLSAHHVALCRSFYYHLHKGRNAKGGNESSCCSA